MTARRRALLALIVAAASLVALVSSASAGSYVVSACSPLSTPASWTAANGAPAGLIAGQHCGGPAVGPIGGGDQGALYAEDILRTPTQIPDGSAAGWTFTAPEQTTITAISYHRNLATDGTSDLVAGLFQANGGALDQCMIPWPFPPGSSITCSKPNNQAPVTFTGLNTSSLFFGVACRIVDGAAACIDGGSIHSAQADLYSAQVTLSQMVPPTLTNPTGPLWGGGVVFASVPVTFSATDPSGIQSATIRADSGQTAAAAGQTCDYSSSRPCPQLPTTTLNADTTRLPDGPHTFTVAATDAADNTQTATSPRVVVDNHGPPPPAPFTATAQGAGSNAIALTWTNPVSPPAPVTAAAAELCQATCSTPFPVSDSGSAVITAPRAGQYSVRLWLVDALGRGGPQNAAVANVTVPPPGGSSGTGGTGHPLHTRIAATYKGRCLHVTATIAGIPDGTHVRVTWRAHSQLRPALGHGFRVVRIRLHKLDLTFNLTAQARHASIGVAARIGHRLLAGARALPA